MANMNLHENYCDGNSSASETAAAARAALTDAGFLAFLGSRLAKPNAGLPR
jgi:hypothetical protein